MRIHNGTMSQLLRIKPVNAWACRVCALGEPAKRGRPTAATGGWPRLRGTGVPSPAAIVAGDRPAPASAARYSSTMPAHAGGYGRGAGPLGRRSFLVAFEMQPRPAGSHLRCDPAPDAKGRVSNATPPNSSKSARLLRLRSSTILCWTPVPAATRSDVVVMWSPWTSTSARPLTSRPARSRRRRAPGRCHRGWPRGCHATNGRGHRLDTNF
jgi:hypothetical protein